MKTIKLIETEARGTDCLRINVDALCDGKVYPLVSECLPSRVDQELAAAILETFGTQVCVEQ